MLCSIRSERLLMEEIEYSILSHWFVGLNLDEEVWGCDLFHRLEVTYLQQRRDEGRIKASNQAFDTPTRASERGAVSPQGLAVEMTAGH